MASDLSAAPPAGLAPAVPRLAYTIAETAAAFGISQRTVERRIADGTLPATRKLGVVLIPARALDALLAEAGEPKRRRRR